MIATESMSIAPKISTGPAQIRPALKPQPSIICKHNYPNSHHFVISEHKYGSYFLGNQNLGAHLSCSTGQGPWTRSNTKIRRDLAAYSSVQPGPPIPSGTPPNSWKSWILGMAISMILPFLRHKWRPLFYLTSRVESVVETAELVAEVIEKTADKVEKVAEEISDNLADGGKLKNVVDFVENVAREAAKDAHSAGDFIDKVQEVQDDVETLIGQGNEQVNETANEAKDTK